MEGAMADALRWLEAAESHTYEVLAILLPGVALLALCPYLLAPFGIAFRPPSGWAPWIIAGYILGFGLQGIGGIASHLARLLGEARIPAEATACPPADMVAKAHARVAALARVEECKLSQDDVVPLARVLLGEKAVRYDRFVALADLGRSLMVLAAVSAIAFAAVALWGSPPEPGSRAVNLRLLEAGASVIAFIAFWNRRRRYLDSSQRIVCAMVLLHRAPEDSAGAAAGPDATSRC